MQLQRPVVTADDSKMITEESDREFRETLNGAMLTTPAALSRCSKAADADARAMMGIWKLCNESPVIQQHVEERTEVDCLTGDDTGRVPWYDIASTAFSVVMRIVTVAMNIDVVIQYYTMGHYNHFAWMLICMVLTTLITTLIYAQMCHHNEEFRRVRKTATQKVGMVLSLFVRYWNLLVYSVQCKFAELRGDRQAMREFYKLVVTEESDVSFILLFECFFETTPLKILTISIMLSMEDNITSVQLILILLYFGSTAWALSRYSRCIRAAQADKKTLSYLSMVPQLSGYFCITTSRTLCIACIAALYPLWTLIACLCHAFIYGSITFQMERPRFANIPPSCNYPFSLALGVIYLHVYVPVKDAPTRYKYVVYYLFCFVENVACIVLFVIFATSDMRMPAFLFYTLCVLGIAMYILGFVCMIIYYTYCHPNVKRAKQ